MNSRVISKFLMEDEGYYARGREVFIRLSLLALMGVSCVLLLGPFLNLIICGIIISVGIYPAHQMLTRALGGRAKLSAALCSIMLLLVLIVPSVLLGGTLAGGVQTITSQLQAGRLDIPPPPSSLDKLPIVGRRLEELWTLGSTNLSELARRFAPQIKEGIPVVISASAGIGGALILFLVAIILAGYFLATSEANGRFATRVFVRIFNDRGAEFRDLVLSTIKTVATGILGVAVIQTIFASLGFWIVGLPGAGLWALVFLIASVLQVGVVALLPAVLYGFAAFSTTRAVIFLVWCVVVGLMDNVLKPILLGRGAKVPMPVIFLGVLGGFMFMNSIIGLFVGAIVLSVGYKLFMAWLDSGVSVVVAADEEVPVPEPLP
jgi:predicted PurR-regulated permease PerM